MAEPSHNSPPNVVDASPRLLVVGGILNIPLGPEGPGAPLGLKPTGTHVQKGDCLLESPLETSPTPLAPVDGVLGAVVTATLLSGARVMAVQLLVDAVSSGEAPNSAAYTHASPPVEGDVTASAEALVASALSQSGPTALPSTPSQPVTATASSLGLPGLISALCAGGVRIDRVGSPDLVGQLVAALKRPIGVVIGSCLEIDPSSQGQARTLTQSMDDVLAGLSILKQATDAQRAICVVDRQLPSSILQPLRIAATRLKIELLPMDGGYPRYHPTLLLHRILKLRLRPRRLPVDVGALVIDAPGAVDVADCILREQPMLTTRLDIHDWSRQRCIRVIAPIGSTVGQVLEQIISPPPQRGTLRAGAVYRNVPVEVDSLCGGGEYTIQILPELRQVHVDPCVRCGWCVDVCPTRIHPAGLVEAIQRNNLPMAEDYGLDACIECGLCSWVCPSHLPLLQSIRTMINLPRETDDFKHQSPM